MNNIIIRADGNARIGAGHLMRCLTIARELKSREGTAFICADTQSAELVREHGFTAYVLGTDYRSPSRELHGWEQLREQKKAGLAGEKTTILVDSYYVTDSYLQALRRLGRVVLLDDMAERIMPADVIINYNVFAHRAMYEGEELRRDMQLYTGGSYIPVRRAFCNRTYTVRERVKRVLITTGGGDADNIAGRILAAIYEEGIHYQVVAGKFHPHYAALSAFAAEHAGVEVLHDVKDMAGLMCGCDMAITAGGTTVYELCSIGVPFICFSYARNQEKLVEYMGREGVALSAGKYHESAKKALEEIREGYLRLKQDNALRLRCSERERTVVDGQGAGRIARILEKEG